MIEIVFLVDEAAEGEQPAEELGPVGAQAIEMMADFLLQVVRQENLRQVAFTRAR